MFATSLRSKKTRPSAESLALSSAAVTMNSATTALNSFLRYNRNTTSSSTSAMLCYALLSLTSSLSIWRRDGFSSRALRNVRDCHTLLCCTAQFSEVSLSHHDVRHVFVIQLLPFLHSFHSSDFPFLCFYPSSILIFSLLFISL